MVTPEELSNYTRRFKHLCLFGKAFLFFFALVVIVGLILGATNAGLYVLRNIVDGVLGAGFGLSFVLYLFFRLLIVIESREIRAELIKHKLLPEDQTFAWSSPGAIFFIPFWELIYPKRFIALFDDLQKHPDYVRELQEATVESVPGSEGTR